MVVAKHALGYAIDMATPPLFEDFHTLCTMKKMFGSRMFFVNNNMWTGVHQDSLIMRMSEDDRGEILRSFPEVNMFEPMAGRIMTEYVELPESFVRDDTMLADWLKRSHEFVATMPPKVQKKKSTKKIKKTKKK